MFELQENEYLTLRVRGESLYKEKGSKFFGYAIPFEDSSTLKEALLEFKQKHHQARHHCFAYCINPEQMEERANDDGEPMHSAGTPILGQIQSKNLVNVLVVVVRYFGGTKLGVSGLIRAYKTAAAEALEASEIEKREIEKTIFILFDYAEMNDVMRILKKWDARLLNQEMHLRVEMKLSTRKDKVLALKSELNLLKSLTFTAL